MSAVVAHAGQPPVPHDAWTAWNADPLLIGVLVVAAWAYWRGQRGGRRQTDAWRRRCFGGALLALAFALLSPLDAVAGALASAHMVQHLMLVLIAAPLLALSAPSSSLLRGSPLPVRRTSGRWRRRFGVNGALRALRHPVTAWVFHAGTLWLWHAAYLYDAALRLSAVHAVEHATLLFAGVLFWRVVAGGRGAGRVVPGLGVLLIFGMAMQSVFLSVLLTFARTSWYAGYAETTTAWGLTPLADQQLAGVIMWIPAGMIYLAAALTLFVRWMQSTELESASL